MALRGPMLGAGADDDTRPDAGFRVDFRVSVHDGAGMDAGRKSGFRMEQGGRAGEYGVGIWHQQAGLWQCVFQAFRHDQGTGAGGASLGRYISR
jgi:hypothetical protein